MHFDEQFYVAVVTVIFFAATFKPMKRGLLNMLDGRIEGIKKNLAEAERLKLEATKLLKEAEAKLAKSEKDAKQIIEHANSEAKTILDNAKKKLEKDIELRKKMALQKIQSFEEKAVDELKKSISAITVEVAAKAIDDAGNDNNFKKLVTSSIDKLSKTVH